MAVACHLAGANPALADAADEARAIDQQVAALIRASKYLPAEVLAQRGLLLCEDTGAVKVFCTSQFNVMLGDIAFAQAQYDAALAYHQQALRVREAGLGSGHILVSRSTLRIAIIYLSLKRMAEAETFAERAVAGFEKSAPGTRELAISLGYLREIYLKTGRVALAVGLARRELELYEGISDPASRQARLNLSTILLLQARSIFDKANYSGAEPILIEAIKLIDPLGPDAFKAFSALQALLGLAYQREGRYAEAEPFLLRALEYHSKFAGPADADTPTLLGNLATFYSSLSKPAETIAYGVRTIAWLDGNGQEKPSLGFALVQVGRAQQQLGRLAEAEAALLRARDVFDRVLPKGDPQRLGVRNDIGQLLIGQERYNDAGQIYKSALEIEPELARPAIGWRPMLLSALGLAYREQARYAEARQSVQEAITIEEAAGNARVTSLGQNLTLLAGILRRENRYADAEAALTRALKLELPESDRASALNSLGVIYTTVDQYQKAEPVLKEALAIRTRVLPANHFFIAETVGNLATIDSSRGQYADAEQKLRYALQVADPQGQSRTSNAALYSSLLSHALLTEGKLDEADVLIRRALDVYQERLGAGHPRYGGALKTLASIEAARGQDREATDHYAQALAIDQTAIGPQSPAVAGDLLNLVPLLKRAGKRVEANANIDRALAIDIAQFGADSPVTAGVIRASANTAYEEGQYADARQSMDRVRQILERTFGPEHHVMAGIWTFLARLDIAQGKLDDARTDIDRAASIAAKALAPDLFAGIDVLEGRADVAWARGELIEAEQAFRDALGVAEKLFEADHSVRRNAVDRLSAALWAQGKTADAERLQRDQLAVVELLRGPDHPSTAIATRAVARILGSTSRQREAISLFRVALAIDDRAYGPLSDQAASDHLAIGSLLRRVGQFEDARIEINLARNAWEQQDRLLAVNSALEELAALAIEQGSLAEGVVFVERKLGTLEQTFGSESPLLAATLAQLGMYQLLLGQPDAAEKILARITALIGNDPPEQIQGYLNVLYMRAELHAERGRIDDAEAGLLRAIAIAAKYVGPEGGAVGNYTFNLALLYLKVGRYQQAIDHFAKALVVYKKEGGDRASTVGYALLGAAQAYGKIGDTASSDALSAAAREILGPTMAAQRPLPRWL